MQGDEGRFGQASRRAVMGPVPGVARWPHYDAIMP